MLSPAPVADQPQVQRRGPSSSGGSKRTPRPAGTEKGQGPGAGAAGSLILRGCRQRENPHREGRGGRPRNPWKAGAPPVRGEGYLGVDADGDAYDYCRRKGFVQLWDCPCCGQLHKRQLPCMAKDCWHCHEAASSRRGARRHELMGGRGIMAIVITLPRQWGELLSGDLVNALRKRVAALVLDALEQVKRVRMGCTVAVHPCGDSGDSAHKGTHLASFEGSRAWGPHFHVSAPLCGLRYGRVVGLRGYDKPRGGESKGRLVRALERAAQELLDELAADLGQEPVRANVHYRYMKAAEPEKVGHRLRYDLRTFPDWSAAGDKGLDRALTIRGYGLLAPNARCPSCAGSWGEKEPRPDAKVPRCSCGDGEGLAGWRAAIRYENPEGEGLSCRTCWEERKQRVTLQLMLVTSEKGGVYRQLAPFCIDLDQEDGEGQEQPQGPPSGAALP